MLNYDKLILDTSNLFYRVAALYLKELKPDTLLQLIKSNTVFSHYKSVIENFATQTLGEVCLLFDPMLSNKGMSTRLKIKEGYKTARDYNSPSGQLRRDTLEKLYSEFITNVRSRISVFHDVTYEADDFVEKLTEDGNCLLISSDEDFARYLEAGRVEMLTKGLSVKQENIFTAEDFETKHGFKPTIASVTFFKVFYGDVSDNIVGVFKDTTTKVIRPACDEMDTIIKELGEGKMSLSEAKNQYFYGLGRFEKFSELLKLSNTARSYEKFLDLTDANFKVIESMLPRSSDIDINRFKVKLDLSIKKPSNQTFTLNKKK